MSDLVKWPADVDEVIQGDLTAAAAYCTPAGGTVVMAVAPCGIGQREAGVLGFTTSLGFGKKLDRIIRDPHVALAYHAREHGFSANPAFVLAQGTASVDLTPSRDRLEALIPQAERYLGKGMRARYGIGCCTSTTRSGSLWISSCSGSPPGQTSALPVRDR